MTLTELRYIVAVARERHFGRAAEACFVSQPTLSVAVRKLEEELGVALFERGTTEVTVTPTGQRVVEQARRVLEEAEAIKHIAVQGRDDLRGLLRLGAIYTVGPYLLPHLIPLLRARAPAMPLQIEENYTAVLGEKLKAGKLDVLLLSLPYADAGVDTEALYEEPFAVMMPAGHRLAREEAIEPASLSEEDLLLLGPGHCFRDQVLQACPECNRAGVPADTLQKTLEGSSLETIRLMVATGAGVTVLPLTSLTGFPSPGGLVQVRPFTAPQPTRQVALAWRRRFPRPGAVRILAEAVRACPFDTRVRLLDGA